VAEILGVSKKTLSKIINEKGTITPDMALRLGRAFDTTPDFWLSLQKNFAIRFVFQEALSITQLFQAVFLHIRG
jgi:addiction module HigA family antidote